jgi:light-regulated signal transduction histidine kinase (bacteriophytochrome)
MQDLINDILRFSKISVEKQSFEEVDLNGVVKEVLSEMEGVIREKNAEITIDPLPILPASTVLMGPLFSNLISNSLKYTKKNEIPRVRIRYEEGPVTTGMNGREPETRYGRIYIEDNGIGFEQKYAEQIFDMFRRLHSNVEYEGTGIGLAFVRRSSKCTGASFRRWASRVKALSLSCRCRCRLPKKKYWSQSLQSFRRKMRNNHQIHTLVVWGRTCQHGF